MKNTGQNEIKAAKRFYIITGVVLLAIAFYLIPLPVKVDTSLEGIYWIDESDSQTANNGLPADNSQTADNSRLEENCTVKAEGWYYFYLFKDDVFKGSIHVSCGERSADNNLLDLKFGHILDLKFSHQYGFQGKVASFTIFNDEMNQVDTAGELVIDGAFKRVFIYLSKYGMVTAPAKDRKEAVDLALNLCRPDMAYK